MVEMKEPPGDQSCDLSLTFNLLHCVVAIATPPRSQKKQIGFKLKQTKFI